METFLYFLLIYAINVLICCCYHAYNATDIPNTNIKFIKITFLPYLIYKLIRKQKI